MPVSRKCSVEGCGRPHHARGLCPAHYLRWLNTGDAGGTLRTARGEPRRYLAEEVLPYDGDECLIWPYGKLGDGYGQIKHEGRPQHVSRIVCEHINGPPPTPKHEAAHSCGRGQDGCVTPRHLTWKTRAGNHADILVHGTSCRGSRHGLAKLTADDVRQIRKLKGHKTRREIAEQFGLSKGYVGRIHAGETWGWLT